MSSLVRKTKRNTVMATVTKSLLHPDIITFKQNNGQPLRSRQTRLYRAARSKDALLFDISVGAENYTDQQCMSLLKKQHPNVFGCVRVSVALNRYLEVYITPEKDSNDILANGLFFVDSQLKVLPCKATDDKAKVIFVELFHLPMFTNDEILAGLQQSLALFGEILDLGIYTEKATDFFMGTGYAVLNVYQAPETSSCEMYPSLHHQISWCGSTTEVFHARWDDISMTKVLSQKRTY